MAGGDIVQRSIREVIELHDFFSVWFRSETAATADFARCEEAIASDFRMVTPEGSIHQRAEVIARIRAGRASAGGGFRIQILQSSVVWQRDDAVLLEYIERQYRERQETNRQSTALFTNATAAPGGVLWRHLHETWIA
jgi:hypothetical protein